MVEVTTVTVWAVEVVEFLDFFLALYLVAAEAVSAALAVVSEAVLESDILETL